MNFYASETDQNKQPVGERHGPYSTEEEALKIAERLSLDEAERRLTDQLANPGIRQNPKITFGVFSED